MFFIGNSYPANRSKTHLEIHPSFIGNSYLANRSKTHLEIHPFFIGNSYPADGSKTHLEIHLSVVGNSYPEISSQIHTSRIHTFIVGNFDFIRLMDEFQAPWVPQCMRKKKKNTGAYLGPKRQ